MSCAAAVILRSAVRVSVSWCLVGPCRWTNSSLKLMTSSRGQHFGGERGERESDFSDLRVLAWALLALQFKLFSASPGWPAKLDHSAEQHITAQHSSAQHQRPKRTRLNTQQQSAAHSSATQQQRQAGCFCWSPVLGSLLLSPYLSAPHPLPTPSSILIDCLSSSSRITLLLSSLPSSLLELAAVSVFPYITTGYSASTHSH